MFSPAPFLLRGESKPSFSPISPPITSMLHITKAYSPILVTLSGNSIALMLLQPLKAPSPMVLIPFPKVTYASSEHS